MDHGGKQPHERFMKLARQTICGCDVQPFQVHVTRPRAALEKEPLALGGMRGIRLTHRMRDIGRQRIGAPIGHRGSQQTIGLLRGENGATTGADAEVPATPIRPPLAIQYGFVRPPKADISGYPRPLAL